MKTTKFQIRLITQSGRYVPTDPNEAMNLATELTKNGVKFYVKDREIAVRSRSHPTHNPRAAGRRPSSKPEAFKKISNTLKAT